MDQFNDREPSPPRNAPAFEYHDLSTKRKVWVVGDIHGCFKLLKSQLKKVGFDKEQDVLVSVGDLVNRGPNNELVTKWLARMLRVVGNHEELTARAFHYGRNGYASDDFCLHYGQGGKWFWENLSEEEQAQMAEALWKAPVALEIKTPKGHRIGVAHARVPSNDWELFKTILCDENHPLHEGVQTRAIWCRSHIERLESEGSTKRVKGIDRVFFGHTPNKTILHHKNCVWLDTKAYHTKNLSIVDVDDWIEKHPEKKDKFRRFPNHETPQTTHHTQNRRDNHPDAHVRRLLKTPRGRICSPRLRCLWQTNPQN